MKKTSRFVAVVAILLMFVGCGAIAEYGEYSIPMDRTISGGGPYGLVTNEPGEYDLDYLNHYDFLEGDAPESDRITLDDVHNYVTWVHGQDGEKIEFIDYIYAPGTTQPYFLYYHIDDSEGLIFNLKDLSSKSYEGSADMYRPYIDSEKLYFDDYSAFFYTNSDAEIINIETEKVVEWTEQTKMYAYDYEGTSFETKKQSVERAKQYK